MISCDRAEEYVYAEAFGLPAPVLAPGDGGTALSMQDEITRLSEHASRLEAALEAERLVSGAMTAIAEERAKQMDVLRARLELMMVDRGEF